MSLSFFFLLARQELGSNDRVHLDSGVSGQEMIMDLADRDCNATGIGGPLRFSWFCRSSWAEGVISERDVHGEEQSKQAQDQDGTPYRWQTSPLHALGKQSTCGFKQMYAPLDFRQAA